MFTNIAFFDTDVDLGMLGRLAPSNKRFWFHRWQHRYLWIFYGLMIVKWQLFDDFYNALRGRCANHHIPRPKGKELFIFLAGKILFFSWAFGLPLFFHPLSQVLLFYGLAMVIAIATLSLVFILPHGSGESEFPVPEEKTSRITNQWAVHQVRVTVDFMRNSPVATWLSGGLNFHREHHLFPAMCHVHYPRIAGIVDEVCEKFGIKHSEHHSYVSGLAAHYRWLRHMGRALYDSHELHEGIVFCLLLRPQRKCSLENRMARTGAVLSDQNQFNHTTFGLLALWCVSGFHQASVHVE
ncbi:fatty acid desaturase [bacterium]|nr:fatty acid desaturase [candidate division CSSED10-310 bacterium]